MVVVECPGIGVGAVSVGFDLATLGRVREMTAVVESVMEEWKCVTNKCMKLNREGKKKFVDEKLKCLCGPRKCQPCVPLGNDFESSGRGGRISFDSLPFLPE